MIPRATSSHSSYLSTNDTPKHCEKNLIKVIHMILGEVQSYDVQYCLQTKTISFKTKNLSSKKEIQNLLNGFIFSGTYPIVSLDKKNPKEGKIRFTKNPPPKEASPTIEQLGILEGKILNVFSKSKINIYTHSYDFSKKEIYFNIQQGPSEELIQKILNQEIFEGVHPVGTKTTLGLLKICFT